MMACDTTVHTVIQSGLLVWKETLNLVFLLSEFWAGSGGDQHREAAHCAGYMRPVGLPFFCPWNPVGGALC